MALASSNPHTSLPERIACAIGRLFYRDPALDPRLTDAEQHNAAFCNGMYARIMRQPRVCPYRRETHEVAVDGWLKGWTVEDARSAPLDLPRLVNPNAATPLVRPTRRHKAEPGECVYCDRERNTDFHPPHDASARCQSSKHNHCSCDTCF